MMASAGFDTTNDRGGTNSGGHVHLYGHGPGGPTIEQVVKAVTCILDASSPAIDRQAAHQLCESIKQGPGAPAFGLQLASLEMPLSVRLFGLNVLEEYVRTRLALTEAPSLRDRIWSLLSLVVAVPPNERRLMQDKCAMLVAQLAMRIWPQYWPDFFDRLLDFVVPNPEEAFARTVDPQQMAAAMVRTEMGLLMARLVVDEVHSREGSASTQQQRLIWDDTRRPELQRALTIVLPPMLDRLHRLIPYFAGLGLGPTQVPSMSKFLLTLGEAYASLALWTPLEREPTVHTVLGLAHLAGLQNSDELTGGMLEALATIAARPTRPQEADLVADLFDALLEPAQQLLARFAAGGATAVDDGRYEHFKRLTDVLVTMGSLHMGGSHRKPPCLPRRLDGFLDLMLQLSAFPSLLVASTVGSFWNALGKGGERMLTLPALVDRLPALFLYALLTLAQDRRGERRRPPYNTEDFGGPLGETEAEADFEALFGTHQNRTMDLLRQLAHVHPARLTDYCARAVASFVGERGGPSALAAPLDAASLRQWDALMHATDAVLKAIHVRLKTGDPGADGASSAIRELAQAVGSLADNLVVSPAVHGETLYLWFVALRMLTPCLGALRSPHYGPLVERLFALAFSYCDPVASMQFAVRARASTTILKACQADPGLFVPAVDYLVRLYGPLPGPGSGEGERERRLLTEMLLLTAGAVEGSPRRCELIRLVLGPLAEEMDWLGTNVLASLDSLVAAQGRGGDDAASGSHLSLRRRLSSLLALLYVVLGNLRKLAIAGDVRSLINQFVPPTMGFLVRSLLLLHQAYDRATAGRMGPEWEALFGEDVLASDVPAVEKGLDGDLMAETGEAVSGRSLRAHYYMLRVTTYLDLGALYGLAPQLLWTSGSAEQLLAPLTGAHSFSLTQWSLLTKHLLAPMLLSVGAAEGLVRARRDVIQRLLTVLIEQLGMGTLQAAHRHFEEAQERAGTQETLQTSMSPRPGSFAATASSNSGGGGGGSGSAALTDNSTARESAQEALLGTSTSALLGLFFDLLLPVAERDKRSDPVLDLGHLRSRTAVHADPTSSPLALFIMRQEQSQLTGRLLTLLISLLRWRRVAPGTVSSVALSPAVYSAACLSKVTAIIARWLPSLMLAPGAIHHETLLGGLVSPLLEALMMPALSEQHAAVTALLTELLKWQIYYKYDAIERHIESVLGLSPLLQPILRELRTYFLQAAPPPSVKSQRAHVRSTLVRALQQQALAAGGVTSTVPRLPDRLVVLRKLKAEAAAEDDVNLDLAAFFDQ